jgi:Protein of unknown function (DUF2800)
MSEEIEDEDLDHYPWGASAAKTWRGCYGSIAYTKLKRANGEIPENNSTVYSEDGVKAHAVADDVLSGRMKREDMPEGYIEHLEGYFALAQELWDNAPDGAIVYNEQKIPLFYNKQANGTVDYAVVSEESVDLLDLKWGEGEYVEAHENDQMIIYSLSVIEHLMAIYEFTNDTVVRVHIYQPRHHKFDGVAQVWETTYGDLKDFAVDIYQDYEFSKNITPENLDEETDLTPKYGACRFCPARKICIRKNSALFDDLPDEINPFKGDIDTTTAKPKIDDNVRRRLAEKGKEIIKFIEDLNDDSVDLIERGVKIAGLKTVDGGDGRRAWANEEEANKLFREVPAGERFLPKKLKSPAQLEAVLKLMGTPLKDKTTRFRNRFTELVKRPKGKPKLALESDPKPARQTALDLFEEEVDINDCI